MSSGDRNVFIAIALVEDERAERGAREPREERRARGEQPPRAREDQRAGGDPGQELERDRDLVARAADPVHEREQIRVERPLLEHLAAQDVAARDPERPVAVVPLVRAMLGRQRGGEVAERIDRAHGDRDGDHPPELATTARASVRGAGTAH